MIIRFRQTGGFGGLVLGCDIDTTDLPEKERDRLFRLLDQANLKKIGTCQHAAGRDLTTYTITIDDPKTPTTASFDEMSLPKDVAPLLEFFQSRAKAIPLE